MDKASQWIKQINGYSKSMDKAGQWIKQINE
jgi:hypothetical protein